MQEKIDDTKCWQGKIYKYIDPEKLYKWIGMTGIIQLIPSRHLLTQSQQ